MLYSLHGLVETETLQIEFRKLSQSEDQKVFRYYVWKFSCV